MCVCVWMGEIVKSSWWAFLGKIITIIIIIIDMLYACNEYTSLFNEHTFNYHVGLVVISITIIIVVIIITNFFYNFQ